MISVCFQGKAFNTTVIQVDAPTTKAEEAKLNGSVKTYKTFQNTKKDVLFIIGDWDAKAGRQEIPGVTDKFSLGVQTEAEQRLTEFCQDNAWVIANTMGLATTQEQTLHMDITRWSILKSD